MITTIALSGIAGDDLLLEFAITDLDGVAVPITGATVRFVLGPSADPAASTEVSPQTATVDRTNDAGGIFRVAVAGDVTQDLLGDYPWQVELDVGGKKATPMRGIYTFKADLI